MNGEGRPVPPFGTQGRPKKRRTAAPDSTAVQSAARNSAAPLYSSSLRALPLPLPQLLALLLLLALLPLLLLLLLLLAAALAHSFSARRATFGSPRCKLNYITMHYII